MYFSWILSRLVGFPQKESPLTSMKIPKKSKFASEKQAVQYSPKNDKTSGSSVISKYYFHDALLKEDPWRKQ